MKILEGKKGYLLLVSFSSLLQVLMSLIRVTQGISTSTILGFFLHFILCFVLIIYNRERSPFKICFSVIIGTLVLQLPIRIISFDSTSITFIEFIFQLLGPPYALLISRHKGKTTRLVLIILAIPIITMGGIYINKFWKHYLDFGYFSSDIYRKVVVDIYGTDIQGNKIAINAYQDKIVLLDFWHTKCAACFKKFPTLQRLSNKYRSDTNIVILAVNHPLKEDTLNHAFSMIAENKYTFRTIILSDDQIAGKIGVIYFPTTIILNRKGDIIFTGDIEEAATRLEKERR